MYYDDPPMNFAELVSDFTYLISLVIPLIFALTLVIIIWKVVDAWIFSAGDPTKIEAGKNTVFVGVLVLVVMSGIWGILALLRYSIFGV